MPNVTVEQLKTKVGELKQQLAEKAEALQGVELRTLKKRLRRLQRKHRRYSSTLAKNAAPAPAEATKPAETAAPAAADTAKVEEPAAESPAASPEETKAE